MAKLRTAGFAGGLSGTAGNAVYAQTKYGTILRDRPGRSRTTSQAQQEVRLRMARANQAYRSLTLAQIEAWRDYARALAEAAPSPEGAPAPSGQQLFVAYATKLLQLDPQAAPPVEPPIALFPGDGVRLTLAPIPGGVRLTADAPNHPGVTTEILTQRLPSMGCRTYLQRYRSARFHRFTEHALSLDLALPPGATALALRFVETATGRQTGILELGPMLV